MLKFTKQVLKSQLFHIFQHKKAYISGLILVSASSVANLINFVFNSYLGRVLTFENFAMIGLMGSLLSFASILFGAFTTTANYKSAFLIGKYGDNAGYTFWRFIRKRAIILSLILSFVWIVSIPFLRSIFRDGSVGLFVFFALILLVGLANGADRGLLSARLNFAGLAVINFFDPVIRLGGAIILVYIGLKYWTFSVIPVAIFGTFVIGWLLIILPKGQKELTTHKEEIKQFPYVFFFASLLTGFSSIAFSSFDILLANHFLSPTEAGKYTLLSLVGKMIYYLGGLTSPFVIPLLSRVEGAKKNSTKTMYILLVCTFLLTFVGFVALGMFGAISIPLLYGKKALVIVPYLTMFAFGMMCYTVSKVFVNYYLVKKVYSITLATSLLVIVQIGLIALFHANAGMMGMVMAGIWALHLVLTTSFHIFFPKILPLEQKIKVFIKNR